MSEGAFEARVSAKRETRDGIFMTLEIQPSDYNADLSMLRVGSALQVGWAEILDTSVQEIKAEPIKFKKSDSKKERKRFAELPASQQAAMLCDDKRFQTFLATFYRREWNDPTGYSGETEVDQFAARAIRMICGVKSRADIPSNPVALERWQTLLGRYNEWQATQDYAGSIR